MNNQTSRIKSCEYKTRYIKYLVYTDNQKTLRLHAQSFEDMHSFSFFEDISILVRYD